LQRLGKTPAALRKRGRPFRKKRGKKSNVERTNSHNMGKKWGEPPIKKKKRSPLGEKTGNTASLPNKDEGGKTDSSAVLFRIREKKGKQGRSYRTKGNTLETDSSTRAPREERQMAELPTPKKRKRKNWTERPISAIRQERRDKTYYSPEKTELPEKRRVFRKEKGQGRRHRKKEKNNGTPSSPDRKKTHAEGPRATDHT